MLVCSINRFIPYRWRICSPPADSLKRLHAVGRYSSSSGGYLGSLVLWFMQFASSQQAGKTTNSQGKQLWRTQACLSWLMTGSQISCRLAQQWTTALVNIDYEAFLRGGLLSRTGSQEKAAGEVKQCCLCLICYPSLLPTFMVSFSLPSHAFFPSWN